MIKEYDKALEFMIAICKEYSLGNKEYGEVVEQIVNSIDEETIRVFYMGNYKAHDEACSDKNNDWLWDFTEAAADFLEL